MEQIPTRSFEENRCAVRPQASKVGELVMDEERSRGDRGVYV